MKYVIGVDLGGTKILTILAAMSGNISAEIKLPTEAQDGPEKVIERILESIATVQQQCGVEPANLVAVALGVPGPELDTKQGVVHFSNNLNWHGVPLKEMLQNRLQVPVYIENDANAAALGEYAFGAANASGDMVYITVSTGVGGGIIINGQIYHGISDGAGEIGHMTIMPGGPRCTCGNYGCLEALASGTAIGRAAVELIEEGNGSAILQVAGGEKSAVSAQVVAESAKQGDPEALQIISDAARALGIGIANVVNILNPPSVVLGGGVMESKDLIWPGMERELKDRCFDIPFKALQILPAALGSKAGAMGAVALALNSVNKNEGELPCPTY
ncbi:MAG: ROK family protein [Firmicutes bacterium]|nr:ROK family protein [Bacillota bacterium]